MPLYRYVKAPLQLNYPPAVIPVKRPKKKLSGIIAPILVTVGSLMVTTAVWPIVQYQIFLRPGLERVEFISPIPESLLAHNRPNNLEMPNPQPNVAGLTALGNDFGYTNPRTWFPEAEFKTETRELQPITVYSLSIPKVEIEKAMVRLNGEDLSQGLIHYPGTALPGQSGSPVIFGHSVLRQFYNPSIRNPDRYMSIFSKIMILKNGDPIYLDYGEVRYTYIVRDKVEVQPEDVFILEQRYALNELKLITCVPEGTYLRRGVVIAALAETGPIPTE